MNLLAIVQGGFSFVAGAMLGALYFALLARSARLHTENARIIRILPLYAVRLAAAGVGFWLIAQLGAMPLLLALLGFLVARIAMQRRIGSR